MQTVKYPHAKSDPYPCSNVTRWGCAVFEFTVTRRKKISMQPQILLKQSIWLSEIINFPMNKRGKFLKKRWCCVGRGV